MFTLTQNISKHLYLTTSTKSYTPLLFSLPKKILRDRLNRGDPILPSPLEKPFPPIPLRKGGARGLYNTFTLTQNIPKHLYLITSNGRYTHLVFSASYWKIIKNIIQENK